MGLWRILRGSGAPFLAILCLCQLAPGQLLPPIRNVVSLPPPPAWSRASLAARLCVPLDPRLGRPGGQLT